MHRCRETVTDRRGQRERKREGQMEKREEERYWPSLKAKSLGSVLSIK